MIVPMSKVFVVARAADRRKLLETLAALGVVHLAPVDPARARAEEQTVAALDRLGRAMQVLGELHPAGAAPDLAPEAAAAEVLDIQRAQAERHNRLARLHRQVEHLEIWGDVRLEQLKELTDAGVTLRSATVPVKALAGVQADCVQVIRPVGRRSVLVALADLGEPAPLPAGAAELAVPETDRPSLRAEAAKIDRELRAAGARLAELANLLPAMQAARRRLQTKAAFTIADRSGLAEEALFALQGWVPADQAGRLPGELEARRLPAAVAAQPARPEDNPPTLIRPPRWARPIIGLFKMLGIVPGYREQDLSIPFMVALPIFSAMLISDGGYGLLFLLAPLLIRRRVVAAIGANMANLMVVIGALSVVWGIVTGSFFGVDVAGLLLRRPPLVPVDMTDWSQNLMMRVSFTIGLVHLVVGQLWRGVALWPHLAMLGRVGWAAFLGGMYGVVNHFVLGDQAPWEGNTLYAYLLMGGGGLAVLFNSPSRNVVKMVLLGIANFPLSAMATFSDIMSYVRLMAVGLAGSVLATEFNHMGLAAGPVLMAPILLLGHGLNVGLLTIALFAHGVRLNVLEFSTNVGMEWSGDAYEPFGREAAQER
jgi:V/A-type H+-transporting ATPase subunit I